MIRYALVCGQDHGFEAWFRNSEAFDEQSRAGLLDCPHCGSPEVRKALMAPAVRTGKAQTAPAEAPVATPEILPPVIDDPRARHLRTLLRELHANVRATAENVGPSFPEEARRIHGGEVAPRAIYGTATGDEARALVEDGVEIMPLPSLPDERN